MQINPAIKIQYLRPTQSAIFPAPREPMAAPRSKELRVREGVREESGEDRRDERRTKNERKRRERRRRRAKRGKEE